MAYKPKSTLDFHHFVVMALVGITQEDALNFWFSHENQTLHPVDNTIYKSIQNGLDAVWNQLLQSLTIQDLQWFGNNCVTATIPGIYAIPNGPNNTLRTYMLYAYHRGLIQILINVAPAVAPGA